MSRDRAENRERTVSVQNGWMMMVVILGLLAADVAFFLRSIGAPPPRNPWEVFLAFVGFFILIILAKGFFTLQPNEARALVLFGAYHGTVRKPGFHWGNPFYWNGRSFSAAIAALSGSKSPQVDHGRNKISLRARTLNSEKLKVNDKRGNPIEIAAVVVWRVEDTAQAMFDVDDYEGYVETQSESSLRHLASQYAYDDGADNESTLRGNVEEISRALRRELEERLAKAGVLVDEARLTHLAYAPEIAQAMLRRQQAEAVIAAREKIVHGAVSMVDMALKELAAKDVVHLDDERRAAMVSNLMVVLCGDSEIHPVINTGTLYN